MSKRKVKDETDVLLPNGNIGYLSENTKIINISVIAGKGRGRQIREVIGFMKIKCLKDVHRGTSLKANAIYNARHGQAGMLAVTDESGEEYAYPADMFEIVTEADILEMADNIVDKIGISRKELAELLLRAG